MKQNYNQNKIFKFIKAWLLLAVLVVEALIFTLPAQAATCNYNIQFGGDRSVALPTDTVNLTAIITRSTSGSLTSCTTQVQVTLYFNTNNGNPDAQADVTQVNFNGNGGSTATANFSFNLNRLPKNSTVVNFSAYVSTGLIGAGLTKSAYWTVNITGTSSTSQGVSISLNPTKSSYTLGDSLGIYASMSSSLYSSSQSNGVQNAYFNLIINGQGGYDDKTVPLSTFSGQAAVNYGTMDLTTDNGFRAGANSITVELWSAGTSLKLGSGTSNINIINSPTASGGGQVYACKDGSGVYQCSPGNKKDLSDVSSNTGGCAYDYTDPSNVALQVNSSWCGKTDAQISAQGAGSGPTAQTACTGSGQGTCPNANQTCTAGVCQTNFSGPTTGGNANLYNPLPQDTLVGTFLVLAQGFLSVLGVFAVVFIIIGGFQMVVGSGNEEAYIKGRKTIIWAVLGLVVALLSFSIIAIVEDVLQANIQAPTTTTTTTNTPSTPQGNIPDNQPQGNIPGSQPQGNIP